MTPLRTCTKCGVAKARTREFFDALPAPKPPATRYSPDGLRAFCKLCRAAIARSRHAANPAKARGYDLKRRQENPDHYLEKNRRSYAKHADKRREEKRLAYAADPAGQLAIKKAWLLGAPERIEAKRLRDKAYYKANRARYRAQADRRRAAEVGTAGWWTEEDIAHMHAAQDRCCYYCDKPLSDGYEIDHRIPLSRTELNPSNWPENLCLACRHCNRVKHNKTEAEFMRLLGGRP